VEVLLTIWVIALVLAMAAALVTSYLLPREDL
jgi:hypothetical protein